MRVQGGGSCTELGAIAEHAGDDDLALGIAGEWLREREQWLELPPAEADGEDRAPPRPPRCEVERGIMPENGPLQLLERRAGIDPELVDERLSRDPVVLERLGLAAGPVQREHELRQQALAQGVLRDECLELRHELGVLPEREVGVDPSLDRQQVQVLQAHDRRLRERLEGEIRKGRPAPEPERLAQQPGGCGGICRGSLLEEPLEAADVELLRVDPDDVAGRNGSEELPRRSRAPCAAARRSPGAPQHPAPVTPPARAPRSAGPRRRPGSHGAAGTRAGHAGVGRASDTGRSVLHNLERAEDPELQSAFRGASAGCQ